jgi:acetyltransferase-like isoleucine patch superfamily enzyme
MLKKIYKRISLLCKIKHGRTDKPLVDISNYRIHPSAMIYDKQNVILSDSSQVTEYVIIRAPLGKVEVGAHSVIGPFSVLLGGESGIRIGEYVMIAPHCVFAAGNHEYRNLDVPMLLAGTFSNGPIIVEDDVWIGANCTICDNVRISKGAIIGANSIVNTDVAPYDIVGGVPIRRLSNRTKFKNEPE